MDVRLKRFVKWLRGFNEHDMLIRTDIEAAIRAASGPDCWGVTDWQSQFVGLLRDHIGPVTAAQAYQWLRAIIKGEDTEPSEGGRLFRLKKRQA